VCDGSTYSITGTYSKLYAVIGTTYGSGSGYFGLPDMRGVFPKGAGTTNRVAGKDSSGNYYAATLGEYATDKMQGHKHAKNSTFTPGAPGSMIHSITDGTNNNASENVGVPVDDGTNGTPRTGHTTEPQSLGLTFIIKY
jgi:microcystin-dependent protein